MATPDGWATAAPQLHAVRAARRSRCSWSCVHWHLQWRVLAFDRLWQHLAPTATLFETNSPHAASAIIRKQHAVNLFQKKWQLVPGVAIIGQMPDLTIG